MLYSVWYIILKPNYLLKCWNSKNEKLTILKEIAIDKKQKTWDFMPNFSKKLDKYHSKIKFFLSKIFSTIKTQRLGWEL